MNELSIEEVMEVYREQFGAWPMMKAYGYTDEGYKEVLILHLEKGSPLDESFDWYADLPPGATA